MKKYLVVALAMLVLASCTKTVVVTNPKPLPPGQAKKVAGAKSASSFTPAAQKKGTTPAKSSTKPTPAKGAKKK